MDPRKQNARRGFRQREAIRRQNTSQWQPEFFPKEEKMNASMNEARKGIGPGTKLLIVLFVLAIIATCILIAIWNPFGIQITRKLTTPPPAVVEKPMSLLPTPVPVVPTTAPVVVQPTAIPMPVAVVCDTPFIDASLDGGKTWESMGLFLDTNLGKRMTFTSRSLLVPEKEWNVTLTAEELLTVEETWQSISICVPEGTFGRVFAGGFEQKLNHLDSGVLMTLKPGLYEFKLRNGEIVLWYPEQKDFAAKDLDRIIEQIKFGNFDIKSALAFFGVTTDLLPSIPGELAKERNVQIIPFPDPVVK